MTPIERENLEFVEKIVMGLDIAYARLLAEKRSKDEEIIVLRDNKITAIKP
jgi:hypothetical protein